VFIVWRLRGAKGEFVSEVFPIAPASAKPIWLLAFICVFLLIIFVALAYTAYSARHSRFEVHPDRLDLVGDFWARSIPIPSLRLEEATVVDLAESPEYSPTRRTLGTGLPGYASGWFRLSNGEKALVYLTRRESVVYLPTSLNYSLLLSTERPRELLAALHSQAGR
jgi:hypothetical protein